MGWEWKLRLQLSNTCHCSLTHCCFHCFFFFLVFFSQLIPNCVPAPCGSTYLLSTLTYLIYITSILTDFLLIPKKGAMTPPTLHPFSPLKSFLLFRDFAVISNSSGFSISFVFLLTCFLPLAYKYTQNSPIQKMRYYIRSFLSNYHTFSP